MAVFLVRARLNSGLDLVGLDLPKRNRRRYTGDANGTGPVGARISGGSQAVWHVLDSSRSENALNSSCLRVIRRLAESTRCNKFRSRSTRGAGESGRPEITPAGGPTGAE